MPEVEVVATDVLTSDETISRPRPRPRRVPLDLEPHMSGGRAAAGAEHVHWLQFAAELKTRARGPASAEICCIIRVHPTGVATG